MRARSGSDTGNDTTSDDTTRRRHRAAPRHRRRVASSRRGVLNIAAGSAGGQVLLLLAAPVLARMYSPADFGVFAVLGTLAATLGAVASGRFELAVPLPERDREAHDLVAVGLVTALGTALAGTVVVLVARDGIAALFDQPALSSWLWLTPWTAAAMAAVQVLNQLAIRYRRYSAIGRRNFLQAGATLLTQLGAGLVGLRSGGMALGLGVGQAVGALSLLPGMRRRGADEDPGTHRRSLWRTALHHRRFPLLLAPSGLINVLGLQLPVLLIAYFYGSAVAGWFGLTQRVLAIPVALLGLAVAQVYLAELSRAARTGSGRAAALFLQASRQLGMVAAAGALLIVFAAPPAFAMVFGPEWSTSGSYVQALAVFTATQLVGSPLSQTLIVFGRQGLQLAWDVGRMILVAAAVTATALAGGSALAAVWAFGLSAAAAYGVSWLLSFHVVTTAHRHGPPRKPEPVPPTLAHSR
ncbi:Membrane protein involved in the export of O-antigen and teichoic acid [Micromonospora nigra]|uniref:Membrane protein involved in the export of O-antigen and teichoic acid n=1 Tax=Micromonospora nigra TaxID=145857 RepID=A0A1C6ST88_9ACTN|nr:lipopolysaccharide biosynthesis protein [Micromonospora nigra]SCL32731.1 Membrane protein involved in the export of O-antigen and teichoic acid [Micromonospora nigra]